MYNPQASFRNILSPIKLDDFFARDYEKNALHIPGPIDKFKGLFDWSDLNRCLEFSQTWDSHNVKMILDGEPIPPIKYCPEGILDRSLVADFLDQGATLVLVGFETLSDGTSSLSKSIQAATGGLVCGNLYFSQKGHAGFKPHFDTQEVFVIQIAGEKTWKIYESQFEHPMLIPGFHQMSFSREFHDQNMGAIETEVTLTPGDVIYLPRGKYHAAVATSNTSLHLSFGAELPRGFDYLQSIVETIPNDPLFREAIPHYDDVEAHRIYLNKLAERFSEKMKETGMINDMRTLQRQRALGNFPMFSLPKSTRSSAYRVRVAGSKFVKRGKSGQLKTAISKIDISPEMAKIVEWILLSDLFSLDDLKSAFSQLDDNQCGKVIFELTDAGLIEKF
jgi:hypothetical protein